MVIIEQRNENRYRVSITQFIVTFVFLAWLDVTQGNSMTSGNPLLRLSIGRHLRAPPAVAIFPRKERPLSCATLDFLKTRSVFSTVVSYRDI